MALVSAFLEIVQKPTIGDTLFELIMFMIPISVAVVLGVLVGWTWKPRWAHTHTTVNSVDCNGNKGESNGLLTAFREFATSVPSLSSLKLHAPDSYSLISEKEDSSLSDMCSLGNLRNENPCHVDEGDLNNFRKLVEEKDGGPSWIHMMEKSTPNMTYQAWRRDPVTGPPQYRSRTIYENATPEMMRDFFWDDEFRLNWDEMLKQAETLEECCETGTMVVQWIRKFPFFCSDREYIIGRRIWESESAYYCITKSVPCSSVPRRDKPRRVDLYYSSWCIRAAESKIDGRLTACEVILFHHEDMGIPWELAKLGVRQGMWGAVKKIDPALRSYQKHRSLEKPLSRSAFLAQINTKACFKTPEKSEESTSGDESRVVVVDKSSRGGIPKILLLGGAIVVACSLDRGLLTKAAIFGAARRFANIGKRL